MLLQTPRSSEPHLPFHLLQVPLLFQAQDMLEHSRGGGDVEEVSQLADRGRVAVFEDEVFDRLQDLSLSLR